MDGGLAFLNALPCPAEQTGRCTNSQCRFKHLSRVRPHRSAALSPVTNNETTQIDTTIDDSGLCAGQDIVRNGASPSEQPVSSSASQPAKRSHPEDQEQPKQAEERAITPPPLKRQKMSTVTVTETVTATMAGHDAKKRPRDDVKPKSAELDTAIRRPPPSVPPPAPAAKQRKAETLNPRQIANAPEQHAKRHTLLQLLHAQYARLNAELKADAAPDEEKLVLADQELIWLALDEEEGIAKSKGSVYASVLKLRVQACKRMGVAKWKEERLEAWRKAEALKSGNAKATKPLGEPKVIETGLSPALEVEVVKRLRTPIDGLGKYGYVVKPPTDGEVEEAKKAQAMGGGFELCDRCSKRFQVFPGRREEDGALASGGHCTYHWGRLMYKPKAVDDPFGTATRRWTCCGAMTGESAGCTTAEHHVFKITDPKRLASVLPFAETPERHDVPESRAVAFDCEMCYTTQGLELIRVTATAWPTEEILLDALVRPLGEILDLNSRFSGVWPQDLADALPYVDDDTKDGTPSKALPRSGKTILPSPAVARALLFALLAPATPLLGHGLENDLNAMRIVHPTLVDTVLLFPHSRGLPVRFGLRVLAETHLNRRIQVESGGADGVVRGHDSAEDARAAGQLVRVKVRDEWARMQAAGWVVEGGALVGPE